MADGQGAHGISEVKKRVPRSRDAAGQRACASILLALAALSALAVWYFFRHGWLLWYGDAEAHLNIARRILDSKTPGYDQIGSPWLPLPHLLMVPFARVTQPPQLRPPRALRHSIRICCICNRRR